MNRSILPKVFITMTKHTIRRCMIAAQIAWGAIAMAQQAGPWNDIYDGPYLFWEQDALVAKWIAAGELREDTLKPGEPLSLEPGVSASFDPASVNFNAAFELSPVTSFAGVENIAVIGDSHGQYGIFYQLLLANGIIDENLNWNFGNGHLVVLGDVFDRGDQVTDIFWLILKLESQAEKAGGKVHFLLGNHEIMILEKDLRYLHKKYRYTMAKTGLPYHDLFGPDTYLGRWLRSKPVAIKINNLVFVHAGFSEPVLQLRLSFSEINTIFKKRIIDRSEDEILADPAATLLSSELGPVWYRGFFSEEFGVEDAYSVARQVKAKHIVVGHTSFPQITAFHNRKIIAADSSIKTGEAGEILLIHKKKFWRGTLNGDRITLK